ncbi:MAG: indole-3-glycerol-phosphate synthase [Acidobacteria bacterium]|nr:indole-3-glycerol-phosphate synthase [Acidobacteriota bacterium]MDP7338172.1 indole-3-glycerol phosphate synthase TrpC [Vicinamibacterales bacterium]MDP7477941.1 indole-3-glycerol phosphate synthase TrpC [Vicinamibacterales bacterium]HJN44570.1 indole-3-glycerol phosphate synthase TrpC [Vicinamibacterales bacterium]
MTDPASPVAPDLLATIVAATRLAVAERQRQCSTAEMTSRARSARPGGARFLAALTASGRVNVIAECKRRSPSRGVLRPNYRPELIAAAYEANGAAAVSVLTEPTFFDGSLDHLRLVRAAVELPILRKDFIVTSYQLAEAAAAGADAVLLIVAALEDAELGALLAEATSLGLGVLVEAHDQLELRRAVRAGATIIGVNNRNLRTLAVDVSASRSLVAEMPAGTVAVAESGLQTSADLVELGAAGYQAFLIGERLLTTPGPGETLGRLIDGARPDTGETDRHLSEVEAGGS